ncbi:hypothetical protein [Pendulispora albinea]|uniref:Uncharacterized protein n=1 Tax=Pendulispora albinea TaxID=2741071 RepID=A0ABZ2LRT6_9BACT
MMVEPRVTNVNEEQTLFRRVLALCGLSPLLGPGTLRRALKDVGADPETATIDDYYRAIPRLEARLRAFLSESEAAQRARTIALLRRQITMGESFAPPPSSEETEVVPSSRERQKTTR